MLERTAQHFAAVAFAILLVTAILKAILLGLDPNALTASDPLLGLSAKSVTWFALAVEGVLCVMYLCEKWRFVWAVLLTAVASQFVLYHAMLLLLGKTGRCFCLGQLWDWLSVSDKAASLYTLGIAFYLFATGIVLIWARAPRKLRACNA